ncbi:MAG: shikimate kinase, partial [Anaerovoracaceae bacterium]|nr:shikimate kinase [Anaerovoracaceae bacterium]
MKKRNVVLIGMPGCGKSTTGILLATELSYDFIDTDLLIIKEERKKLPEIIAEYGNEGLNRIEENLCATLHVHDSIIATGGSVVYGERGMKNLSNEGVIVF